MSKKQIGFILIFNLFIALGFYFENLGVGFSELSSDSQNAIPVCYKIDDQTLFKEDLYLNTLDNVKYYTPFYIETIRFFSTISNGDYLAGINLFATILHFIYGVLWFCGFYIFLKKDFWISFLLSVIVRGIVWLPGYEIWGISDLWTIMPRTFYIAFLPLPFLFLYKAQQNINYVLLAFFTIGLIFNFHPITGIGGILLFVGVLVGYLIFNKEQFNFKYIFIGILMMLLGMFPFVMTYFTKTDVSVGYNLDDYTLAFNERIPSFFTDVTSYSLQWVKPKILFFVLPITGLFILSFFKKSYYKTFWIVFVSFVFIMIFPLLSIVVENFVNSQFNTNLRMSFQLVRAQKTMVVLGLFSLGILLIEFFKMLSEKIKAICVLLFVVLIAFSKLSFFDNIPFIADDISRSVFPVFSEIIAKPEAKHKPIDKLALYIKENTPKESLFTEYFILRSAAQRAVIFDGKGSSMLIEGNPNQFINWYKDANALKSKNNFQDSLELYKQKGVDYLIFKKKRELPNLDFIHQEENLFLYKIK